MRCHPSGRTFASVFASTVLASIAMLFGVGCTRTTPPDEPETALVRGVVTLDGKPLPNAKVVFQPDFGRPSMARTDDEGRYELVYNRNRRGAKVGMHSVTVSTREVATVDGNRVLVRAELVPDAYFQRFGIRHYVLSGENDVPIELDSDFVRVRPPATAPVPSADGTEGGVSPDATPEAVPPTRPVDEPPGTSGVQSRDAPRGG